MRVRGATRDDLDALAALEAEALGRDAWSPALLRAGVIGDLPTIRYLVAVSDDGSVVGHAVASLVADVAELQRIGVTTTARRRGVATALLGAVLDEARAVDATRLLLEVRTDNDGAIAFYIAHGFARIAERRGYYADGATALVMERGVAHDGDQADSSPE